MNTQPYQRYTAPFNPTDIPKLYSEWDWIISEQYLNKPWLMSRFGDLFFEGPDGSIHFIDTLEGMIVPFAENIEKAEERLGSSEAQKRFLASGTVELLEERGMKLKEDELYIYVPHPIVTGAVVIDSIQIMSMNVVTSLTGQLLRQMGQQ